MEAGPQVTGSWGWAESLRTQAPLRDASLDYTVAPAAPLSGFLLPTLATQTWSCSAFLYKQTADFFFFFASLRCTERLLSPAFTSCLPSFPHTGLPGRLTSNPSFLCRLLQPNEQSRWSPPCWLPSPDLPQFAVRVCPLGLSSLLDRGKLAAPPCPRSQHGPGTQWVLQGHLEALPVSEPWAAGLTELGGQGATLEVGFRDAQGLVHSWHCVSWPSPSSPGR